MPAALTHESIPLWKLLYRTRIPDHLGRLGIKSGPIFLLYNVTEAWNWAIA